MSGPPTDGKPLLASLVRSGDQQKEAERITDFIFMAKDISNAYLVTTTDGDVMVNPGFMDNYVSALFLPHTDQHLFPSVLQRVTRAH